MDDPRYFLQVFLRALHDLHRSLPPKDESDSRTLCKGLEYCELVRERNLLHVAQTWFHHQQMDEFTERWAALRADGEDNAFAHPLPDAFPQSEHVISRAVSMATILRKLESGIGDDWDKQHVLHNETELRRLLPGCVAEVESAIDMVNACQWTDYKSPDHWETVFDQTWKNIKRRIKAGDLDAEMQSTRLWRFHKSCVPRAS